MTELELQELDKAVAAKYGIEAYKVIGTEPFYDDECNYRGLIDKRFWLHNDSGRCFDLAVEHEIDIEILPIRANAFHLENHLGNSFLLPCTEFFKDYRNDKQQAARVAVLRALLAKGE